MKVFILGGNKYVGLQLLEALKEKSKVDEVLLLLELKTSTI